MRIQRDGGEPEASFLSGGTLNISELWRAAQAGRFVVRPKQVPPRAADMPRTAHGLRLERFDSSRNLSPARHLAQPQSRPYEQSLPNPFYRRVGAQTDERASVVGFPGHSSG